MSWRCQEHCNPSAILQSWRNSSTDGPTGRPGSIIGGPRVHLLQGDCEIALGLAGLFAILSLLFGAVGDGREGGQFGLGAPFDLAIVVVVPWMCCGIAPGLRGRLRK